MLVNRATSETIDLRADPFGPRHALDLNREVPARRLCGGARREPGWSLDYDTPGYQPATVLNRRVLSFGLDDWELSDCRTRRVRRFGFGAYPLNARHLATRSGSGVTVERLATRRRLRVRGVAMFGLSAGALWTIQASGELRRLRLQSALPRPRR